MVLGVPLCLALEVRTVMGEHCCCLKGRRLQQLQQCCHRLLVEEQGHLQLPWLQEQERQQRREQQQVTQQRQSELECHWPLLHRLLKNSKWQLVLRLFLERQPLSRLQAPYRCRKSHPRLQQL